ncbi:hypothetical protein [Hymenobacter weizhouensis]|uniref:hypothetical protein n=1 Tax=Hymenobacter sp. YIM 151500-1 TaxID=2987689 RepID=UPI0022265616|nr:hypothetical protein [Hymenobacter sp. YIM 151500-1]UYZ61830.1 hypothetical protein OIS53_12545 [Hymenobacter sp. YIM 151500-1]
MSWKAYNPAWAYHEVMRAAAVRWHRRHLLTPAQQQAIGAAYPLDFYRPGLFQRIGLFIFTCIGALAGAGFGALFGAAAGIESFGLWAAACAVGGIAFLEFQIRNSRLYHAGPDNALLYISLAWLYVLVVEIAETLATPPYYVSLSFGHQDFTLVLVPMLTLLVLAAIRYADQPVTAAAYLTALLLAANLLVQVSVGRLLLPFVLMGLSAAAYTLVRRLTRRPDYPYYRRCLGWLKALTLTTFYLAGNYYVVREGNAWLSGASTSSQIPLAPLFYLFTALIPVVYVVHALRRPADRTWLLLGLLTAAFSLFTLRYYRSVLPPEIAAVVGGAVLVGGAAWLARYLRPARHGLTSLPSDEQRLYVNLESLVTAEAVAAPVASAAPAFEFGGGQSGGGGAEGTY